MTMNRPVVVCVNSDMIKIRVQNTQANMQYRFWENLAMMVFVSLISLMIVMLS